MKNIHILQTDKPSRLGRFIDTNNLFIRVSSDIPRGENVNIYITNDEEIKSKNWHILKDGEFKGELRQLISETNSYFSDKVILTTDQDLIKDGVQTIDDEFLEWFVKNPSCESVKTLWTIPAYKIEKEYRIEFPQEERKIDTCYNFDKEIGCVQVDCRCEKEEPKQDTTLEEREPYWDLVDAKAEQNNRIDLDVYANGVLDGVKWQREKSYSEEEVNEIIAEAWNSCEDNEGETFTEARKRIIEQFKKK